MTRAGRLARVRRATALRPRRLSLVVLALLATVGATTARAAPRLGGHGADLSETSVSGVSSGGYMAVQFHVAHSRLVKGAGVLAGGPYYCAQGSVWTASYNCLAPGVWTPVPDPARLRTLTESLAAAGAIDPSSNLAAARVWLFRGTQDTTVSRPVVEALERFYRYFVPERSVVVVNDQPAGHAMVTEEFGNECRGTGSPFINDCDYDAAGELLKHIHGRLRPPSGSPSGTLVEFDQREFAGGDAYAISMADTGYAYVPRACAAGRCRVHVAFHGCRQSAESVGDAFVRHAGYNRWADPNAMIVLYPQTISRSVWWPGAGFVFNPQGCWDWWGYTGPDYHTKSGRQIQAVRSMLERLARPR
jgi:poly(3-hydroxybutyrate) depolymerase